jgi:hypothetical protein
MSQLPILVCFSRSPTKRLCQNYTVPSVLLLVMDTPKKVQPEHLCQEVIQRNLVPLLHQIYKLVPVELCYKIELSQSSGCSETVLLLTMDIPRKVQPEHLCQEVIQRNLVPLQHQIYKLVPVELCYKIQSSQSAGRSETIQKIVGSVVISHPAGRSETVPKIVGPVVISLPAGISTVILKIVSPVVIFFHQASRAVEIFQCYYRDNRAVQLFHQTNRVVRIRYRASRRASRAVQLFQEVIQFTINSEKKTRAPLFISMLIGVSF